MRLSLTIPAAGLALGFAVLTLPWAPTVRAGEDFGDQVRTFEQHLDDYEADVQALASSLDELVADYAEDGQAERDMNAFIQQWEKVGLHAAVETQAQTLYPPIWVAIGGLGQALGAQAPTAKVRARRDRVEAALWQGMGGVKQAAAQKRAGKGQPETARQPESAPAADVATTVDRIQQSLEQAVARYRKGEAKAATQTVHEAYMQRFEGLEGKLIERDVELVANLEQDLNASLPHLMEQGAPVQEVKALVAEMSAKLDRARKLLLAAGEDKSEVF